MQQIKTRMLDIPGDRVFARSSVAFMTETEGTAERFRREKGMAEQRSGGRHRRRRTRVADGGRNQAELKQGQGTRSTGVCFFIYLPLPSSVHLPPSLFCLPRPHSSRLSVPLLFFLCILETTLTTFRQPHNKSPSILDAHVHV